MSSAVESLQAKQAEAARKIQGEKSKISTIEQDNIQLGTTLKKTKEEYEVLVATHDWTKSALSSALSAQEEYRMGYNALKQGLGKAKEELNANHQELAELRV